MLWFCPLPHPWQHQPTGVSSSFHTEDVGTHLIPACPHPSGVSLFSDLKASYVIPRQWPPLPPSLLPSPVWVRFGGGHVCWVVGRVGCRTHLVGWVAAVELKKRPRMSLGSRVRGVCRAGDPLICRSSGPEGLTGVEAAGAGRRGARAVQQASRPGPVASHLFRTAVPIVQMRQAKRVEAHTAGGELRSQPRPLPGHRARA